MLAERECSGRSTEPKYTMVCVGKYEYMPDGSWTGAWTCTDTFKSGDTKIESWEEGSHLKEYKYKYTGGTGKYQGALATAPTRWRN
jgi:hypothetical protein